MQTINVTEGQTLPDIAMQYCGDALMVFEIAALNGIEVTSDLTVGQELIVPDAAIDKGKIASVFNDVIIPASADTDEGLDKPEGIDYWYVEDDFVVQ